MPRRAVEHAVADVRPPVARAGTTRRRPGSALGRTRSPDASGSRRCRRCSRGSRRAVVAVGAGGAPAVRRTTEFAPSAPTTARAAISPSRTTRSGATCEPPDAVPAELRTAGDGRVDEGGVEHRAAGSPGSAGRSRAATVAAAGRAQPQPRHGGRPTSVEAVHAERVEQVERRARRCRRRRSCRGGRRRRRAAAPARRGAPAAPAARPRRPPGRHRRSRRRRARPRTHHHPAPAAARVRPRRRRDWPRAPRTRARRGSGAHRTDRRRSARPARRRRDGRRPADRPLRAATRRAPRRRVGAHPAADRRRRGVRRDQQARHRAAPARRPPAARSPSSAATAPRAGTVIPRPTCSTSPTSRSCCAAPRAPGGDRPGGRRRHRRDAGRQRSAGRAPRPADRHAGALRADAVLGCDGAHSTVRDGVGAVLRDCASPSGGWSSTCAVAGPLDRGAGSTRCVDPAARRRSCT